MVVELNEPVRVGAVFFRGAVTPVWFSRSGRQVRVREVTFSWATREGSARVLHFSASDGSAMFELCFNTTTLDWRLEQVEDRS